jgi:WD40 repeat protein
MRRAAVLLTCLLAAPAPAAAPPALRRDHLGDALPRGAVARLGTTRLRQYGAPHVLSVAFSPDSRLIASSGEPRVWLWDSATGKKLRALQAPSTGNTNAVAFSADGSLLAAGVRDNKGNNLFVWQVATGKLLRTFAGHKGEPRATAFLDKGKTLVSVGSEGKVCWWDVATGKRQHEWDPVARQRRPKAALRFLEFYHATLSANAEALAATVGWRTASSDTPRGFVLERSIIVWSLVTRREAWRFGEYSGWGSCPAFSRDGGRIAFGWSTSTPAVYHAATGEARHVLDLPDVKKDPVEGDLKEVCHSAFSPDGKRLAVATRGFGVRLWDLRTGKRLRAFCPPGALAHRKATGFLRVALSPNGKRVLLTWRQKIWLWDTATGREIPSAKGHDHPPDYLHFSADGKSLLSSSLVSAGEEWHEGIRWSTATWKPSARWKVEGWFGRPVPCSPDHTLEVQRDRDGFLFVRRRAGGKRFAMLDLRYKRDVRASGFFSPNNQLLVMPTLDRPRKLWLFDAVTGKRLGELSPRVGEVCFAFSPDNKAVAWFDERGVIHVADTGGKAKWRFGPRGGRGGAGRAPPALVFSPDGRYLASWNDTDSAVRIWDLATGKEHRRLLQQAVGPFQGRAVGLAYSPDGRTLAVSGTTGDNVIRLWEVDSGQPCRELRGHRLPVNALAFSPDGRLLASASEDMTALIWDLTGSAPADLASLWPALAGEPAPAHRALWRLVGAPERAIPFLRTRLRPAAAPARRLQRQMDDWLTKLDDDDFDVRERATQELEKLGHLAGPPLRRALQGGPTPEKRRRAQRLLARLARLPFPPEDLRPLRAAEALEHIGTPQARRLLQVLAAGDPDARLTRQAGEAVQRLSRRP